MANTKGRTRDVNAALRATQAIQLRAKKMSYDDIAKQCGYASRGACHDAIMRELSHVVVENVKELRREELLTLDTMQIECMALFLDKENKGRLFAADRILQIMDHRAKLMGIYAPKDGNVATNTVVIREVPHGYFGAQKGEVKDG